MTFLQVNITACTCKKYKKDAHVVVPLLLLNSCPQWLQALKKLR